MKGWGTDEKGLINVLCRRTGTQRVQIVHAYKASYGKVWHHLQPSSYMQCKFVQRQDLEAKIKSETSGNFERVLVGLVRSRAEFLAHELHRAMNGLGTKESTLIEVLCSSTNQEIRDINQAYQTSIHLNLWLFLTVHFFVFLSSLWKVLGEWHHRRYFRNFRVAVNFVGPGK